jgi:Fur family ferric uptake transcriptional regulator
VSRLDTPSSGGDVQRMDEHLADRTLGFREAMRKVNLRATGSRLAVMRCLAVFQRPASHQEVMDAIGGEGWDRATVYRILSDLADAHLLHRFDPGDHIWRFELHEDHSHDDGEPQVHFLCVTCGTVTCLEGVEIRAPKGPTGSRWDDVQIRGRCGDCAG